MSRSLALLLTVLAALALAGPADPCAAVRSVKYDDASRRKGPETPAMRATRALRVAAEDVLIVWDAARKMQHFVRAVDFDGADPSFGFLVPTPSAPEVAEAPAAVFGGLKKLLVRPIVRRVYHKVKLGFLIGEVGSLFLSSSAELRSAKTAAAVFDDGMAGGVNVRFRSERPIAGFDVAVLDAKDTAALGRWLEDNGFTYRKSLDGWLKPYVENGWSITAFKLAASEVEHAGRRTRTRAVRLSFSTDKPFFPYREPADQRAPGSFDPQRVMRAFVVSAQRTNARAEDGAAVALSVPYAKERDDLATMLAGAVPAEALPAKAWVTCLVDRSAPRKGDGDLIYEPAKDQATITPPPVYDNHTKWDYQAGGDLPLLLLLLIGIPAARFGGRWRLPIGGAVAGAAFALLFLGVVLGAVGTREALGSIALGALGFGAIGALVAAVRGSGAEAAEA